MSSCILCGGLRIVACLLAAVSIVLVGCDRQASSPSRLESAIRVGQTMPTVSDQPSNADLVSEVRIASDKLTTGVAVETTRKPALQGGVAKLVVEDTVHHFGVMSPREVRSHTFHYRNAGNAPLKVTGTATNCKCVMHTLSQTLLQPGEEGSLRLKWRGGDIEKDRLTARVRIETNDPELEVVEFSAIGRVAAQISLAPVEFKAQQVTPGESVTLISTLGSHVWEEFSLAEIKPSSDAFQIDAVPLTKKQRDTLGVRDGWRLTLRAESPATLESCQDHVEIQVSGRVRAGAEPQQRTLRIPVSWELRQAVTLSGPGVDEQGGIHLGKLARKPLRKRYLLKVNDDQPELTLLSTRITPSFLDARLEPYRVTSKSSLYRLEITGPTAGLAPDAAEGALRLEFDHPRIKFFEAAVELGASI